jgi:poly(3-hydroxyalkanoate) synthetase
MIEGAVALCGGRVFGSVSLTRWLTGMDREYEAEHALQCDPDAELSARFEAWNEHSLNLPGRYFIETTEWLFRDNWLAENRFPALGGLCGLADVTAPVFVLAARDDRVVALAQATAAERDCVNAEVVVRVADGGHLSLFMGRRTLAEHWPGIAEWLVARG